MSYRRRLLVPGAAHQRVECHPDLSAATRSATGRSDTGDWAGDAADTCPQLAETD